MTTMSAHIETARAALPGMSKDELGMSHAEAAALLSRIEAACQGKTFARTEQAEDVVSYFFHQACGEEPTHESCMIVALHKITL